MSPTPGPGRSPGGGDGNPLQCSCLQNPTDRGAWRAPVHGVTQVRHDWSDLARTWVLPAEAENGKHWPQDCVLYRTRQWHPRQPEDQEVRWWGSFTEQHCVGESEGGSGASGRGWQAMGSAVQRWSAVRSSLGQPVLQHTLFPEAPSLVLQAF